MWWGGREALDLKKRNAAYQELCDAKAGSDKYVPRAAQTLNPATKDKGSHAVPPLTRSVKVSAEGFAIADAFREQVLWVGGCCGGQPGVCSVGLCGRWWCGNCLSEGAAF